MKGCWTVGMNLHPGQRGVPDARLDTSGTWHAQAFVLLTGEGMGLALVTMGGAGPCSRGTQGYWLHTVRIRHGAGRAAGQCHGPAPGRPHTVWHGAGRSPVGKRWLVSVGRQGGLESVVQVKSRVGVYSRRTGPKPSNTGQQASLWSKYEFRS